MVISQKVHVRHGVGWYNRGMYQVDLITPTASTRLPNQRSPRCIASRVEDVSIEVLHALEQVQGGALTALERVFIGIEGKKLWAGYV